jgi:hypothetical protein
MSTPVICASVDFFPPVDAFKKHAKMRLQRATSRIAPCFPQRFPQNNLLEWETNVPVQMCEMNQTMLLTAQPWVPHCVS